MDYVSPKLMGAITVNVLGIFNNNAGAANNGTETDEDSVNVGVTYSANGLTASVQHISDIEATRLTMAYKTDMWSVGVSYEEVDNAHTADADNSEQLYVSATFNVSENTKLAASYGDVAAAGEDASGARDSAGEGFTVGVFQKVAPKTTITVMYSEVDYDNNTTGSLGLYDRDLLAIGLIQGFDL